MKRKFFVLAVVLLVCAAVPVFAGDEGSAIGTFGVGFNSGLNSGIAMSFDLDLVSNWGITISFGTMINFIINEHISTLAYFGFGYRYLADTWDVGASVVAIGLPFSLDGMVGLKANGGYWFTESFGVTLTMMGGISVVNDYLFFSLRPGFSVRL